MEPEFTSIFALEPTLRRVNGNVTLLKKLMGSFAAHYRDAGNELSNLVRQQDYTGAELLAHRLAAAAAQLGATALSQAAGVIEQALQDRSPDGIDGLLEEVQNLLRQAATAAAAYSTSVGP